MFYRNLNKIPYRHFCKFSTDKFAHPVKELRWNLNEAGANIYFDIPHKSSTVFQIVPKMTFNHFIFANSFDEKNVIYPPTVNGETEVYSYLLNLENQQTVQFIHHGQNCILKNKANQSDSKELVKAIREKDSLYQNLKQFKQTNNPQSSSDITDYLTRYYLKLQAQYYCRAHKISLQSKMTPQLKQKILIFLSQKNQINVQEQIYQNIGQIAKIRTSIDETNSKINIINDYFQNRIKWYKNIAIGVTFIHLVGFGYMIFGVDWLGWDIIQPLTYTVGVLYTLLGIRFYRKYGVNRSQQTIRNALFRIIMSPRKKAQLKQLNSRLQVQMKQYKKILQQERILKNKLSFNTSLLRYLE